MLTAVICSYWSCSQEPATLSVCPNVCILVLDSERIVPNINLVTDLLFPTERLTKGCLFQCLHGMIVSPLLDCKFSALRLAH